MNKNPYHISILDKNVILKDKLKYVLFLVLTLYLFSCKQDALVDRNSVFQSIDSGESGINFRNDLTYTEEFNVYLFKSFYNGSGVGLGDLNNDGELEILAGGNFYANQINIGKSDASYGHFFKRDIQNNSWQTIAPQQSGFAVKGEVRDIKVLNSSRGKKLILVSRNNDELKLFTN